MRKVSFPGPERFERNCCALQSHARSNSGSCERARGVAECSAESAGHVRLVGKAYGGGCFGEPSAPQDQVAGPVDANLFQVGVRG